MFSYFNRKPIIDIIPNSNYILSPAFGTIQSIELNSQTNNYEISIFLSLFDIHSQYYPCDGNVLSIMYDDTGKYEIANDIGKSRDNTKCIILLDNGIQITQLAGMVARTIETVPKKHAKQGEYMGCIYLGSRVDITIPKNRYRLLCSVGDTVNGPYSHIAKKFAALRK